MSKTPPTPEEITELANAMTLDLVDRGKLIAGGYAGFIQAAYGDAKNVPYDQLQQLHAAFFAGAQHTFAGVVHVIDHAASEAQASRRMDRINAELQQFIRDFAKKHGVPTGRTQ